MVLNLEVQIYPLDIFGFARWRGISSCGITCSGKSVGKGESLLPSPGKEQVREYADEYAYLIFVAIE
jgi:hypothetical protein